MGDAPQQADALYLFGCLCLRHGQLGEGSLEVSPPRVGHAAWPASFLPEAIESRVLFAGVRFRCLRLWFRTGQVQRGRERGGAGGVGG